MNVPTVGRSIAGVLSCPPTDVRPRDVQDHLIRHPIGMDHLLAPHANGSRRWNAEGWDRTDPPVISDVVRRELTAKIKGLRAMGGRSCAVPRLESESYRGEPLRAPFEFCKRCPEELVDSCVAASGVVASRYLGWVDRVLASLDGAAGEIVRRTDLVRVAHRLLGREEPKLAGLTVAWLGVARDDDGFAVARVTAWEGVRVEFYAAGARLRWRTTYRNGLETPASRLTFVLDPPRRSRSFTGACDLASDRCVVPRRWWEAVQNVI